MVQPSSIRPATLQDQNELNAFLKFEYRVHRHLDWRLPQDWLGNQPFYLLQGPHSIQAALCCPIDPPGTAWVHLFAHSAAIQGTHAWTNLFERAYLDLLEMDPKIRVAALGLQPWFSKLLVQQGFILHQNIITLSWQGHLSSPGPANTAPSIRPMNEDDLDAVAALDAASFESIWVLSPASLRAAFNLSAYACVAEIDGHLAGYQISTANFNFAHLARLAVSPSYRGHAVGKHLVEDMLSYFTSAGVTQITVNTQSTNQTSQALYKKTGFVRVGDSYPVYLYPPARGEDDDQ